MSIQKGVRQRRQEKIRRLTEQNKAVYGDVPVSYGREYYPDNRKDEETQDVPVEQRDDRYEPDPELVWKAEHRDWRRYEGYNQGHNQSHNRNITSHPTSDDRHTDRGGPPLLRELRTKLLLAILVFGGVWGLFQLKENWVLPAQSFVTKALTQNMDFAAAAAWYRENFAGTPTFIPIFGDKGQEAESVNGGVKQTVVAPLTGGAVVRTFAEMLNGVEIAGKPNQEVVSVQEGRVSLVSGDKSSGITVVIQHAGNRTSIYGDLSSTQVKQGDWLKPGQSVGQVGAMPGQSDTALLYFAVKENGSYVDPADVVPFD